MNKIKEGSIVKIKDEKGYYRVTAVKGVNAPYNGKKANLGSVFGRTIYHKGVEFSRLEECEAEWYAAWSKTETYQCM